jgi:hypothetical protein
MLLLELNLDIEQAKIGYRKLSSFLSNESNKLLLLKTIDNCVNSSGWPDRYYYLRDEYLPAILGQDASKFLFWSIYYPIDELLAEIKPNYNDAVFIKYLVYNYFDIFFRAKRNTSEPFGFYNLHYTYSADSSSYNLHLYRNDGNKFLLRLNIIDSYRMFDEMLTYLIELNKDMGPSLDSETMEYLTGYIHSVSEKLNELTSALRRDGDDDGE